jgi:hypothetical protein
MLLLGAQQGGNPALRPLRLLLCQQPQRLLQLLLHIRQLRCVLSLLLLLLLTHMLLLLV